MQNLTQQQENKPWYLNPWMIAWVILLFVPMLDRAIQHNFNNYLIFKFSAPHLFKGITLYHHHLDEHFDQYKYGPSFAFLMYPFQFLPDVVGSILWNVINLACLLFGLKKVLPQWNERFIVLWIALPDLIGNFQNFQSNIFLIGLFLITYHYLETGKWWWAAIAAALSVHFKLFGAGMIFLGFLYPRIQWKFFISSAVFILLIAALPLLAIDFGSLHQQYIYWKWSMEYDGTYSAGISLAGLIMGFTGVKISNLVVSLSSVFFLTIPFLYTNKLSSRVRETMFFAVTIWMVLFNYKAESATFIIPLVGFALWYVHSQYERKKWLLYTVLFFVGVLYSDLVPTSIRDAYVVVYKLKVWPFFGIWIYLQYQFIKEAKFEWPLGELRRTKRDSQFHPQRPHETATT